MGNYLRFLRDIMMQPRKVQSDFARYHAHFTAEAATRGHIAYYGQWYITKTGIELLQTFKETYH